MTQVKHTPTPWFYYRDEQRGNFEGIYKMLPQGYAYCNHPILEKEYVGDGFETNMPSVEDAEFIVRACNAHYDLVAALEISLEAIEAWGSQVRKDNDQKEQWERDISIIEKALAKAQS